MVTCDYTTPTCPSCGVKVVERVIGGKAAWVVATTRVQKEDFSRKREFSGGCFTTFTGRGCTSCEIMYDPSAASVAALIGACELRDPWTVAYGMARKRSFSAAKTMRYWWVNQKQTNRYEIAGGYLWSPKANRNGARNHFYETCAK